MNRVEKFHAGRSIRASDEKPKTSNLEIFQLNFEVCRAHCSSLERNYLFTNSNLSIWISRWMNHIIMKLSLTPAQPSHLSQDAWISQVAEASDLVFKLVEIDPPTSSVDSFLGIMYILFIGDYVSRVHQPASVVVSCIRSKTLRK